MYYHDNLSYGVSLKVTQKKNVQFMVKSGIESLLNPHSSFEIRKKNMINGDMNNAMSTVWYKSSDDWASFSNQPICIIMYNNYMH